MTAEVLNELILGALILLTFMVAVAAWFFYQIGAAVNEVARQAQEVDDAYPRYAGYEVLPHLKRSPKQSAMLMSAQILRRAIRDTADKYADATPKPSAEFAKIRAKR